MKILLLITSVLFAFNFSHAQDEDIVKIMDKLRGDWDAKVQFLRTYDDLKNMCRNGDFRRDLIALLDQIHHYDTILYNMVKMKYSANSDAEAKATLDDIETLEAEYTTKDFRNFVHQECGEYNMVENSFGKEGEEYESEKKRVEAELIKYVPVITRQIDLIDEHAHHLKL